MLIMKNGHIDCETHFTRTDIIFSEYQDLNLQDKVRLLQEINRAAFFIEPYAKELARALTLLGTDLASDTERENQIAKPSTETKNNK